jgi:hypothetical protein
MLKFNALQFVLWCEQLHVLAEKKAQVLIIKYVFQQWCQNVRCQFMVSGKMSPMIAVAPIKHTYSLIMQLHSMD